MNSSYANYSQFGQNIPISNDPLTYCLADTMDSNFQHGSNSVLYGPRSEKCQTFMAQRCAQNWDGFCEYFYRQHSNENTWPNSRAWPDMNQPTQLAQTSQLSLGEQLLKNTVETKYCTYPTCQPTQVPFNELDPHSPKIIYYKDQFGGSCIPVCSVNPLNIDQDVVMNLALDNPRATGNTLINICNTARREGTNLSGTRLGIVCDNYFKNRQMMR